jgi:hypothetical protein
MILALAVVTALAAAKLLIVAKELYERSKRWQLFALRDELRYKAVSNPALLASPLFDTLDRSLTLLCGNLSDISLWSLAPVILKEPDEQTEARLHETAALLARPENAEFAAIFSKATSLLMHHLCVRHIFITTVIALTVIGGLFVRFMFDRLARYVLTDAFRPAVSRPVTMSQYRVRAA